MNFYIKKDWHSWKNYYQKKKCTRLKWYTDIDYIDKRIIKIVN